TLGNLTEAVTADYNGDGKLDLISTDGNNGKINVYLGNGDGSFNARKSYSVGFLSAPFALATTDLNGDGVPDVVVSTDKLTGNVDEVRVLLANSDGSFKAVTTYLLGTGLAARDFVLGDFNGDGKADFAASMQTGNEVLLSLGNGDGSFNAPRAFATGTTP